MKKPIELLAGLAFLTAISANGLAQVDNTATQGMSPKLSIPVVTVESMGKPHEVIDGVAIYQEFPDFSLGPDPLVAAVARAFQNLETVAKARGADAIVGLRIEFSSRPFRGEEGRVLVYGTLVRLK